MIVAEQLLSTSDSPSTGSTHSPTHMTVSGDADDLTAIKAAMLADSPRPSDGTSDASPTISSDIVTTESADTLTTKSGRPATVTAKLKLAVSLPGSRCSTWRSAFGDAAAVEVQLQELAEALREA